MENTCPGRSNMRTEGEKSNAPLVSVREPQDAARLEGQKDEGLGPIPRALSILTGFL